MRPSSFAPFPPPAKILVFDSGIGGIGTFSELRKRRGQDTLYYLADTGFFPYGEKTDDVLKARILSVISKAVTQLSPNMIIIACNTASTLALSLLREHFPDLLILGCVPPIRWAASLSATRCLGLLSTSATARRSYVDYLQKEFAPDCKIYRHGSASLAKEAEKVFRGDAPSEEIILTEIKALFDLPQQENQKVDAVALGCTHYTFLLPWLKKYSPPGVEWLDPQPAVARHADHLLQEFCLKKSQNLEKASDPVFFYTGEESKAQTDSLFEILKKFGFEKIQKLF